MEASETMNEASEALATEAPEAPAEAAGTETPDLGEQMAALREEVAGLRESYDPEEDVDLYDELAAAEAQPFDEVYEDEGEGPEAEYAGDDEQDVVDEIIRERVAEGVQEALTPFIARQEESQRAEQLAELAEDYPDLPEVVGDIREDLAELARDYGSDWITTDPRLVRAFYALNKLDAALAEEVPAEEAVNQGAALETGAGASAGQSGLSPEEQIKQGVLGGGPGGSAFV